ncbi:MAG: hypothetical protein J6U20_04735 [Fibrobacter sp.]|nr:hypothetical protein [Fibrobacter sp.]
MNRMLLSAVIAAALFSVFPLTDTDIWWHLACAREWVQTWTPSRSPVVNVHEYFQMVVGFVYGIGGAPLLVAFKALLWGIVFALFLRRNACIGSPSESRPEYPFPLKYVFCILLLFVFRYHFEIRPVLFSLLFLGIYWNVLPRLFYSSNLAPRAWSLVFAVFIIQWLWCKCQGLYILGPLFAVAVLISVWLDAWRLKIKLPKKYRMFHVGVVLVLFAMPFLHSEGLNLFLYPFGLLDRLVGMSPSATVFASGIAENRSPLVLLMAGENVLQCVLMIALCIVGLVIAIWNAIKGRLGLIHICLFVTALLALIAERNFVLFLPVFLCGLQARGAIRLVVRSLSPVEGPNHVSRLTSLVSSFPSLVSRLLIGDNSTKVLKHLVSYISSLVSSFPSLVSRLSSLVLIGFLLGLWGRSLLAYDSSMVAFQRVPVGAAAWMTIHPHEGHLFNDDRAGGYLAFVNPDDSIYIDGRFILKTADFFERYLRYADDPALFMHDADSMQVGRAIFPLRYYARWGKLVSALEPHKDWDVVYRDSLYIVLNHNFRKPVCER